MDSAQIIEVINRINMYLTFVQEKNPVQECEVYRHKILSKIGQKLSSKVYSVEEKKFIKLNVNAVEQMALVACFIRTQISPQLQGIFILLDSKYPAKVIRNEKYLH
ncbi:hypothetical protein MYP_684 [Sporocytophaga myxococcoides]|uniref:Uncharacterized protein n=2 Tax=Sporocytophaga myxococcoides TaxID=153721 RepID=A0A098LAJ4_9BACT|nr:hypothetical protein MYP_684 [Sporocytophaga myxococcoides]